MVWIIRLVGVLMIALGILAIVKTEIMKKLLAYIKQDKRIYYIAYIRIVIGAIFLMTAYACRLHLVITVLGILILAAGVSIFVLGKKVCIGFIEKFEEKPVKTLQLLSGIPIAVGLLILIAA